MFVICDQNDIVQDIATEEANLSRGYTFPGYKLWIDADVGDIRIGDSFDGQVLTKNQTLRDEQLQKQQNEKLIQNKIRQTAIDALKATGDLPPDYKD
jgi:hypothetical protein